MTVYESAAPRGGGVTVAAALVALVTIVGLFTRPLLAIDETRYAAVALEMLQRNDWLVPHLNGATYSHKPPLLFWLVLAGWKLFGVSAVWARMVAPLAGVAALWLTAVLARALWPSDARTRGWAPLITAGALLWAAFGTLFMFDTLLACSALLALIGVVHVGGASSGVAAFSWLAARHSRSACCERAGDPGPRTAGRAGGTVVDAPHGRIGAGASGTASLLGAVLLGAGGRTALGDSGRLAGGPEYQQAIFFGQTAGRLTRASRIRRESLVVSAHCPRAAVPVVPVARIVASLRACAAAPRDAGIRFCAVWAGAGAAGVLADERQAGALPVAAGASAALLLSRGLSLREGGTAATAMAGGARACGAERCRGSSPDVDAARRAHSGGHTTRLRGGGRCCRLRRRHAGGLAARSDHAQRGGAFDFGEHGGVALRAAACGSARRARCHTIQRRWRPRSNRRLAAGHPIAMVGTYNGEYHFEGRLRGVQIEIVTQERRIPLAGSHRTGLLLRYDRGRTAPRSRDRVSASVPERLGYACLVSGRCAHRQPRAPQPATDATGCAATARAKAAAMIARICVTFEQECIVSVN